jgi:very-short-patch-repair endonuclease
MPNPPPPESNELLPQITEKARLKHALAVAERQFAVISARQLLHIGLSWSDIERWCQTGRLHRIYRGVYGLGHRPLTAEAWCAAAVLVGGPGAALSHEAAAWWWGLMPTEPTIIDVSGPERRRRVSGVRFHQLSPAAIDARIVRRGLPTTPVSRILLDVATHLPAEQVRRVLAQAEFHRLLDPVQALELCGRGRPGSTILRQAIQAHLAGHHTASELEDRFLALLRRRRVPLPVFNVVVEGLRVDALWHERRVIVELDSVAAHATPARMKLDRARDLRLRTAGYRVARYSWDQVTQEPEAVIRDVRQLLAGQ